MAEPLTLLLNGHLITQDKARLSVFEHGYLYGVGLFETFRTYGGHPFLLDEHLARLKHGCRAIGLPWQRERSDLLSMIRELLQVNRLVDGRFRLNVAAGEAPTGLPSAPYTQLTEILMVTPLLPRPKTKRLVTVKRRRNDPEIDIRLKSHQFLNNVLAQREVPEGAEGIMLTKDGDVAEGVTSNLFFVKEGTLYTPALGTGILNGITRQWVLHMASKWDVRAEEGYYDVSFAKEAEEVFITNSIQELVPVSEWDDYRYPSPGPASLISRLQREYDRQKTTVWSLAQIEEQSS